MKSKSVFQLFSLTVGFLVILNSELRLVSGKIIEVRSTQEWDRRIRRANETLVVAQFYVPWCGYCRYMKPEFVKIAANHADVIFLNVDADQQRNLAWRLGLRSVPTYKFFKYGLIVDSITTWQPSVINDLIDRLKD